MRSARSVTLSAMGTIVALAGFEHGLGELLQGWVAPAGIVIKSWPDSAFYRSLEGEPAMTVIPNLALSGIATIALSIVFLVWVVRFVERPYSALAIAGLSVALLLTGGGFGPPLLGFILAAVAVKVTSPLTWWRRYSAASPVRALCAAWPYLLTTCVVAWLTALVGIAALDYFAGVESVFMTLTVLLLAFGLLLVSIVSSYARDAMPIKGIEQNAGR